METLRLGDAAYVEERYHAIEAERQRRLGPQRASSSALAAAWPLTSAEKDVVVMGDILGELSAQIHRALDAPAAEPPLPELPSFPAKDARKAAAAPVARDAAAPANLDELPMASQLALKMFFRVCASMRATTALGATANARLLAAVAAKVPSMLAKLPVVALSPGVMAATSSFSPSTDQCPAEHGETDQSSRSVFEELLEIFGALLETTSPRAASQADAEKATPSLTDPERANVLMAFVAVSLKWGRLRDLMRVLLLLIENPGTLVASHMEQLATLLAELTNAEAVAPARQLLPDESSACGYLVSFGKGDHGKLGHGQCSHASCSDGNCTENKNVPTVIASTRDVKFVKIDSLSTHSIAITTKGEVMAWGNGDKYRLGHGTTTKEYAPRIIDSLSLKGKVSDVACGLGHTIALMAMGDIYAWGNGSNGRLGLGDTNDRSNPTKLAITMESSPQTRASGGVQAGSSAVFRYVICGASHSLAVTSDGRVFAWGKNNQGQCGHGHTNDQLTAIEVRHFRDELNERVVWAAGGWEHTLFCSTSGRVYSCGCGYKDSRRAGIPPVLGHGDCEKRLKPTVIQTFLDANEEMVRVSCGWDHSLAVSAQGSLYTWGSGTNGKLGHGDEENCETPTLVRSLAGKFVKDAKAGCEHTVALTDTHELWTFGQGDSGRLGLGDTVTRKVPTMVDAFAHSGLQPVAIAVGDKYNLVLADDSGLANRQGALKSPSKKSPSSPTHFGVSKSSNHHILAARSRRGQPPQGSACVENAMRDLNQLLVAAEDRSGAPLRDQGQLLKIIAVNLARIASGYMPSLWCCEGASVAKLPYGVDVAPLTLDRLLTVIRTCRDCLSQSSSLLPPDRAVELIVLCLRILTVNINIWTHRAESSEAAMPSSLLEQIIETVNELASKGATPGQQVLDSDRFLQLQSLIQEEAAHVLRVGFVSFYPTTADRTRLLCELGICDSPISQKMSLRVLTLASKLCEDSVAHNVVLGAFHRAASHACVSISRGSNEAMDSLAASEAESSLFCRLIVALVDACANDATQRLGRSVVEKSDTVTTQLRLLTVLQGHWFGVAACCLSMSSVEGDPSPTASNICDCCVQGLSEYLCLVLDRGASALKMVRKAVCQSEDATCGCLSSSFIDSVVLQAVQGICALFDTIKHGHDGSRVALSMAKKLLPGVRVMMEVLDEISWKLNNSIGDKNSRAEMTDRLAASKHDWVQKMGHVCALLCGQIVSCLITARGVSDENQTSNTCDNALDEPSVCFRGGLNLISELLRQLNTPDMKCALLLKLLEAVKMCASNQGSVRYLSDSQDPEVQQTLAELGAQLSDIAAAEDLSTRTRATALSIWLWILCDAPLAPVKLSELISHSGIVVITGEILLRTPSHSRVLGVPHHGIQQLTSSQRSQPSSRLRLVEEIISMVQPNQTLCRVAHEVFSVAANQLCSVWVAPASEPHPLLTPIQTETSKAKAPAEISRPASSPRRRHTLPKKHTSMSAGETMKAIFDYIYCLLERSSESSERRKDAVSPLLRSFPSQQGAMRSLPPTTAFLLASPLSISSSRSQIVKPIRLPSVANGERKSGPVRAISLWFVVDSPQSAKELTQQPVIVLAGLGEASDRLQEGAPLAGSSMALELGLGDRLRTIVFLCSNNGQLNLGYALAHDAGEATGENVSSTPLVWESKVVEEPIAIGQWIHVSISQAQEATVYVNGRRVNCRSTKSILPNQIQKRDFGTITPRLQLVVGGTLDDELMNGMEISTIRHDESTPQPTPSNPIADVLVDDVWLFSGEIDDMVAQRLYEQGQSIVQLMQEYEADQKTLGVLHLLNQTLALLPVGTDATDSASAVGNGETGSIASCLQCVLFKLLSPLTSESSFQIALRACEGLRRILPVASTPSRDVLEELKSCLTRSNPTAFDLCYEVSKLYAFSTRAGVQSAAIAASQLTVASLLRQAGVMRVSVASEAKDDSMGAKYRDLLAASVIELLQTLSCVPAWQSHCLQMLSDAAVRVTGLQSAEGKDVSVDAVIAAVTVVAGYSEGFVNAQAVALGTIMKPEAPWTSAHRSTLAIEFSSYARAAWRFGCDFQDSMFSLSGGLGSLIAQDIAALGRARLQTLVLRSLIGQLRPQSQLKLVTEWQHGILSNPQALDALLRGALVRPSRTIRARLGPDGKLASRLISVQLLKDAVSRSRSLLSNDARLLIEEDLEVLVSEIQAKFESQQRATLHDAGSILCQHYWRAPRLPRTPLESLSGDVELRGLAVRAIQHFPTVRLGRVAITANSGLWYHEVQLCGDGLMQIGYVDTEFVSDAVQGQGVGDHTNSWAFDGYRRKKWNVSSCDYGEVWQAGDVVGVMLDTDRMELSYFLNGKFLGVAFSNLPLSPTSLLFPAISLNADQRVQFDFGALSTSNTTKEIDRVGRETPRRSLRLPSLGSPLDTQRLRPVALAMDESTSPTQDSDEEPAQVSDFDSDEGDGPPGGAEDDGTYSPLATPTTPPPQSSRIQIYHRSNSGDEHLFIPEQLPGSLHDEGNQPLVPGSLVNSIQATFRGLSRETKRDDSDDGDQDDTHNEDTGDRKAELVQGLVALGFPHTWALRCARETTFTLNDTGAVSWILEQMESEASSSMAERQNRPGDFQEGLDNEKAESESLSAPVARRAHDDSSIGLSGGSVGRRTWQLALSPSRDGRPHSEQFLRSRVQLSSPQKTHEQNSEALSHSKDPPTVSGNPFLLDEVSSEEGDDVYVRESDASAWNATAEQQFYGNISGGSLHRRFARLDLSTNADSTKAKDETPRRLAKHGDHGDEDLLPACLVAHSVLSLAYVRMLTDSLLFDPQSDVKLIYPIIVQWASSERPGLFKFLRIQLQLDARELPVSSSRSEYPSDETRIQTSLTRLLRFELESEFDTGSTSFPLHQAMVTEILAQVANAIRDMKRAKTLSRSTDQVLAVAMNARWTLWLLLSLRKVQLREPNDTDTSIPTAPRKVVIQSLLDPALVSDVTRLASAAPSPSSLAWRNVAFSVLRHVLLMDVATRASPPTKSTSTLIPIHFLVELLASLLRKNQSRQIAYGEPISTLWGMVLAHTPHAPKANACKGDIAGPGAKHEITLRVEQVASTYVTISWECIEQQGSSTSLNEGTSSDGQSIDNSVLSLRVTPRSSSLAAPDEPLSESPSKLASGVPHFLPSKGSLVLRQLAPDTNYMIRITKSRNPLAANECDSLVDATAAGTATITAQEVVVRTPPEPVFELDDEAAGKNLVLSNRNRTVKNLVNKKWHTVRASVGFDEGVHHWHVRIDACVSKNIFIGVATADASLENYVGSDAFGYGFLANKAVWHNKSKIHSYGEIFKQGDLLQVTLDCNARTLSFSRNGEPMGVAASNLHVAATSNHTGDLGGSGGPGSAVGAAGYKWFPAFSLYNKDDQLTLLVPQSSAPHGVGLPRAPSEHASVLSLIESTHRVLRFADHKKPECIDNKRGEAASSVYEEIYAMWRKWKQGDVCWREVGLGEVIEIDTQRDAVAEVFGLAPGDSIFTSRGHCVVLGSHNHELWYEIVDALEFNSNAKASSLGSWSLCVCRDMVSSPDEYPVHRVRRYPRHKDPTDELPARNDFGPDHQDETLPMESVELSESAFLQTQATLAGIPQLDRSLVALVDAVVAHRGLSSAYQLSFADVSSAVVLHDVVNTLRSISADEAVELGQDQVLMRLAWIFHVNQHAYRVVRLFLTQDVSPRWEQSVWAANRNARVDSDADPEKERRDALVAAGRLAANVGFTSDSVWLVEGSDVRGMSPRLLRRFLREHLFESQREQLISEALRRSATPTLAGLGSDAKPAELGEDALLGEPKEMLRLKIRLPSEGPASPFWLPAQSVSRSSEADPVWMLPARERRAGSVFAQVQAYFSAVDPAECRREYPTPQSDSLSIHRSFHLAFMEPSSSGDANNEPVVLAENASQYLKFWDELFTEIQSPRFPLFVPMDSASGDSSSERKLDVNAYLLLPECAVRCGVHTDEALAWFFQLGQLLGMVWRARAIVPLQFVSTAFWTDLLDEDGEDGVVAPPPERLCGARTQVLRAIRDGLYSIVPHECLQLSSPESLRRRLSDNEVFQIDRIHANAVYDRQAPHHEAFWATAHGLSSLERQVLVRFLCGKTSHGAHGDDPIEAWKTQIRAEVSRVDDDLRPPFRLELVDALADAQDHPDACFPVVHVVDAHSSRLHLPAYSSASVLRQKLLLAMTTLPAL